MSGWRDPDQAGGRVYCWECRREATAADPPPAGTLLSGVLPATKTPSPLPPHSMVLTAVTAMGAGECSKSSCIIIFT